MCALRQLSAMCFFFFFNDTATTEIYTLSLHDALPILALTTTTMAAPPASDSRTRRATRRSLAGLDRKSTRLNSSHGYISYAVFCLKTKKLPSASRPMHAGGLLSATHQLCYNSS